MIHAYTTEFNDHAEVLNMVAIKLAFLGLQIQIVLFEMPQDFVRCLSVCHFISTIDQNVIHVDGHLSFHNQICKDHVHEHLERSG